MPASVDFQAVRESLSRAMGAEQNAPQIECGAELGEVCRYVLATQGRRLRGRVLLAAAWQGPDVESPVIVKAACAIELLHLASLAHDDVIDSGTMRRGMPTAGAKFGQQAAAFAGGWLFARAVEMMAECGDDALGPFADTVREMCGGGMREFSDLYDVERTAAEYDTAAENKTASAFRLAARLGAGLAGADEATVAGVATFGLEFGMAYQIWDDLVDLLADAADSGKTPGSDLRHGVYTLPVIYAREEDDAIGQRLGVPVESSADRTHLVTAVKATNGVRRAAAAADARAARAATILHSLPRPEPLRDLLEEVRESHVGLLS